MILFIDLSLLFRNHHGKYALCCDLNVVIIQFYVSQNFDNYYTENQSTENIDGEWVLLRVYAINHL